MKKVLRYAILWHRFLSLPIAVFFCIWFVSGVVLIYAGMPTLTLGNRLLHSPDLNLTNVKVTPSEAYARSGLLTKAARATVGMLGTRPVYRFLPAGSGAAIHWVTIFADNGALLTHLGSGQASQLASSFQGKMAGTEYSVSELSHVDQWTVYPASEPYLPFQRVSLNDKDRTTYYVSERTGTIYLRTTRRERILAWFGAIPHWWYVRALRANDSLWRNVMVAAAGWGIVVCLTGIVTGLLRYSPSRRFRFPGPRYSSIPYVGWKRWHHLFGLIFGLFTFTWIFSGLMTMNPGHWSPGPEPTQSEIRSFAGSSLDFAAFQLTPSEAASHFSACFPPRELELIMFGGHAYYVARGAALRFGLMSAAIRPGDDPATQQCRLTIPQSEFVAAGERIASDGPLKNVSLLRSFDAYYRDNARTHEKPLPVLRLRFGDKKETWLYVNPVTASIEERYTDRSRLERWLYQGIHDFDFPFLYYRRPAWDLIVILLSLGGLTLSITGVVLTYKYLAKRLPRKRRATAAREPEKITTTQ